MEAYSRSNIAFLVRRLRFSSASLAMKMVAVISFSMSSSIHVAVDAVSGAAIEDVEVVEVEEVVDVEVLVEVVHHWPKICCIHSRDVAHSSVSPKISAQVRAIMKYQPPSSVEVVVKVELVVGDAVCRSIPRTQ